MFVLLLIAANETGLLITAGAAVATRVFSVLAICLQEGHSAPRGACKQVQ